MQTFIGIWILILFRMFWAIIWKVLTFGFHVAIQCPVSENYPFIFIRKETWRKLKVIGLYNFNGRLAPVAHYLHQYIRSALKAASSAHAQTAHIWLPVGLAALNGSNCSPVWPLTNSSLISVPHISAFVCLLFYVQAASEVIAGWVQIFDSAHS